MVVTLSKKRMDTLGLIPSNFPVSPYRSTLSAEVIHKASINKITENSNNTLNT
jgi:hypothetical protein